MKTNDNYYNYHKHHNNNTINNNDTYNYDPDYQYYNINNNTIDSRNNDNDNTKSVSKSTNNTNNIDVSLPWVKKQPNSRANTPYNTTTNTNTKTSITAGKSNTNTDDNIENTKISAAKLAMNKLREEHERKKLNEIQMKKSSIDIKKKINHFRKTVHKKLVEKDSTIANGFLRFFNEKNAAAIMEKYKGCSMNIDAFLLLLGNYLGESTRPFSSDAEILQSL
jgi:hypothetical protein